MADIQQLIFDVLLKDNASRGLIGMARTAKDAAGDVKNLQDKLVEVSKASVKARVGLDGNKEANADIDRLQARLIKLGDKTANPNITVEGALKARAEIASVQRQLDQLDRSNAITRLAGAGPLQPSAGGSLLAAGIPALIASAPAAAGAVGLIAASFGAAALGAAGFGIVAGSVLTQASQAATKLQALNLRLATATTKSAKDAVRAQISALEQGWTPTFRKIIGDLQTLTTRWKAVSISIAAPAVATWLNVVTKALTFLRPLLTPVADLFQAWGQSLGKYFSSSKGSTEIKSIATAVGQFAAIQLGDIVQFIKDLGTGIFHLGRDIGANGVQYGAFGGYLQRWGDAFASWSKSKQARDDVTALVHYVRENGHLLVSIIGDLAKLIPGIFAGASAAGTAELRVLSGFLGWIAKLPPSWAKPLTEVIGSLLLLAKTGVLKVGIQVVGKVWDLLRGGTLSLGGASAAAEIRAAMVSGGTAAAAEIRAAMVGGGAAAGGESAAGSAAASGGAAGIFARLGWTGKALTPILRAPLAAATGAAAAWAVGHLVAAFVPPATTKLEAAYRKSTPGIAQAIENFLLGGKAAVINDAITRFQNMVKHGIRVAWDDAIRITQDAQRPFRNALDFVRHDAADAFDKARHAAAHDWDLMWNNTIGRARNGIHGVAGIFDSMRHDIASTFDTIRHNIAHDWDLIWQNTVGRVQRGLHDVAHDFDIMRHDIASTFDTIRHNIASAWDTIWRNTVGRVQRGITDVVGWFRGIPSRLLGALRGIGTAMYNEGHFILTELWNGLKSIASSIGRWFTNFGHTIIGIVKKVLGVFSPSSVFYDIGRNLMIGLRNGVQDHVHHAVNAARAAAGAVGAQGGPTSASAAQAQAYARSRLGAYGWGASQMAPLIALWNQESGWNRFARNPSSGAYGIPQALPPGKMGAAANPPTSSAAAQINWGLGYIKSVYGSPAGAEAHERSAGWYGSGLRDGLFTRPTIIGVGERGPERVNVEPLSSSGKRQPASVSLTQNGDVYIRDPVDWNIVSGKLSFAVTASGFG